MFRKNPMHFTEASMSWNRWCFFAIVYTLLAVSTLVDIQNAAAQELVFDLNQFDASSDPGPLEIVGENIFFFASDGLGARSLYLLEPQSGNIKRLTPLSVDLKAEVLGKFDDAESSSAVQGDKVSGIRTFHDLGGVAVFSFGDDVWRSDGTEGGTYKLASFKYLNYEYAVGGGRVYFWGRQTTDFELWTTDGTPEGTHRIDTTPPLEFGDRSGLAFANDSVYFSALSQTNANGVSLWRSGGGLMDAEEITGSPAVQMWEFPLTVADHFFFVASDYTGLKTGQELWVSDGTGRGTKLIKDIRIGIPSSEPWNFQFLNNQVLFQAFNSEFGGEIWTSDGTTEGTTVVKDINPGSGSAGALYFEQLGKRAFFRASDGTHGYELWVTDGSPDGTTLVRDINPGSAGSSVASTRRHQDLLYFSADDGANGREIWVTDGTYEGTKLAIDLGGAFPSEPSDLVSTGDQLFFAARTYETGRELWVTDGTQAGTRLAADIANLGTESSLIQNTQVQPDGDIVGVGSDGKVSSALWKFSSEPQHNATMLAAVTRSFSGSSITVDGVSFFDTVNGVHRSDGTAAGTFELLAVRAVQFVDLDGRLFIVTYDNVYVTDGSVAGTSSVFAESVSTRFVAAGNDVLYVVRGRYEDSGLWTVDRDATGHFVQSTEGIGDVSAIHVDADGRLFFAGKSGIQTINNTGTERQTLALLDAATMRAEKGIARDGILYFGVRGRYLYAPTSQTGLWRTDGTAEGTYRLPIEPNLASELISAGDKIFFLEDVRPAWNIWSYDPSTSEATKLPVAQGSRKVYTEYEGELLFTADDGHHGLELWQSDGTIEGTSMVVDIYPGAPGSDPSDFAAGVDGFYVTAATPQYGRELMFVSDQYVATETTPAVPDISVTIFPTPFSGTSNLVVQAKASQNLTVEIFDLLGRRVQSLYSGMRANSEDLRLPLNGDNLARGVYFVRATGGLEVSTASFIVWK